MKIANALSYLALGVTLLTLGTLPAEARPIIIREGSGHTIIRLEPSRSPSRTLPAPLSVVPFGSVGDAAGTLKGRYGYPNYYYYQTPRINRRVIYNSTLINPTIINSQIYDSTLVYPRVVSPYGSRKYGHRKVYTHGYPRQHRFIRW